MPLRGIERESTNNACAYFAIRTANDAKTTHRQTNADWWTCNKCENYASFLMACSEYASVNANQITGTFAMWWGNQQKLKLWFFIRSCIVSYKLRIKLNLEFLLLMFITSIAWKWFFLSFGFLIENMNSTEYDQSDSKSSTNIKPAWISILYQNEYFVLHSVCLSTFIWIEYSSICSTIEKSKWSTEIPQQYE